MKALISFVIYMTLAILFGVNSAFPNMYTENLVAGSVGILVILGICSFIVDINRVNSTRDNSWVDNEDRVRVFKAFYEERNNLQPAFTRGLAGGFSFIAIACGHIWFGVFFMIVLLFSWGTGIVCRDEYEKQLEKKNVD